MSASALFALSCSSKKGFGSRAAGRKVEMTDTEKVSQD
jgi:hypothetical protein